MVLDDGSTSIDDSAALTDKYTPSSECSSLLHASVRRKYHAVPPAHHIIAKPELRRFSSITSLFSNPGKDAELDDAPPVQAPITSLDADGSSNSTSDASPPLSPVDKATAEYVRTGFRNPWPSWHKPRLDEVWNGLRWTKRPEQLCDHAADRHASPQDTEDHKVEEASKFAISPAAIEPTSEDDLRILEPDFTDPGDDVVKATWLGHATLHLRLPPLRSSGPACPARNILFDPIFSMR